MTPYEYLFALIVGAVLYATAYRRGKSEGSKPLSLLKPGEYYVEAVIQRFVPQGRPKFVRLVLSWHVDYGHYEYRIADLRDFDIVGDVVDGDTIRVSRKGGRLCYIVVRRLGTPEARTGLHGFA